MEQRILITGSAGLIGSALKARLPHIGAQLELLDIEGIDDEHGDVRDLERLQAAAHGVDGIIHLAAVSRVIWGERDPDLCWATNVGGLQNALHVAQTAQNPPWFIFASSREVYGQPERLPAHEDCPAQPVNIYGRSKIEGERLIEAARSDGLRACTVRLSNVFGSTRDHADRVVPAFARAAVSGHELRVDGAEHTFDFTHIDDVAAGLTALVERLAHNSSPPPPPIHFVSGVPTTLEQLASLAIRLAGSPSNIRYAPPRDFDVARFFGSPERARVELGWTPRVSLEEGLQRLIRAFREEATP